MDYRWYRQQELRYSLSIELFHRFAQQFDITMPVPVVALVVAVILVVPVKGALYV
jgi:hypothetical protein